MLQGLLNAAFDALDWLVSLFPTLDMSIFQLESMLTIFDLIHKSSFFIPWSTVFICCGIVVTFYNTKNTLQLINWLIDKIPFI